MPESLLCFPPAGTGKRARGFFRERVSVFSALWQKNSHGEKIDLICGSFRGKAYYHGRSEDLLYLIMHFSNTQTPPQLIFVVKIVAKKIPNQHTIAGGQN